ncbi:hypothetical protein JOQ06_018827 [Pogonophryne albipinna]|uniref:Coagulation factor IX n=1 Tax=Pogonophryne albipinna TaxID=1090488 RepID=A0AAD6ARR4_9TELE|nr:hypothetical protein JOQ06_018827 [Pogonophryne albipinna]
MAGVCLLAFIAGILLKEYGLAAVIAEENTGAVFVSQRQADTVLRRIRRFNTPLEEVFKTANLERECREETCSMEEAREVFEDIEKTMTFWASYIDGDQCQPPPCQNGASCEDGVNNYVCWCQPNFDGKDCEIEVTKQCSINNGGCSHFCSMKKVQPVCQCAAGYRLGPDKKSCEPTKPFSCGRVDTRFLQTPRSVNTTHSSERKDNSSDTLQDYLYEDDLMEFYDDYNLRTNDSDLSNISLASAAKIRSVRSDSSFEQSDVSEVASEKELLPSWAFFPTLPTIIEKEEMDTRIVGGNEAIPGEIPWQVSLMFHSTVLHRAQPFCGGSLLTELWVITAAHCLLPADISKSGFFVRAGEHDVDKDEGPERDHLVAEQHIHPLYNDKKSKFNHDIALLKLASPVELSNERRPICFGPKDFIENLLRDSSSSMVSGWGRLRFQGPEASRLQKLEVPHVDRTLCKQSSRDHATVITRYMFCAGYSREMKDSCQGDSGGPHFTKYEDTWFLTGIVSWGENCAADGKYGVYTRVSRYYAWISQKTGLRVKN